MINIVLGVETICNVTVWVLSVWFNDSSSKSNKQENIFNNGSCIF